jgi:hypothetical protein
MRRHVKPTAGGRPEPEPTAAETGAAAALLLWGANLAYSGWAVGPSLGLNQAFVLIR